MTMRIVTSDTTISWDYSQQFVPAGTIVDIPPGSPLEAAYGGNLASLSGTALSNAQQGDGGQGTENA